MDSKQIRWPRKSRRHRISAALQHRGVRPISTGDHGGGGVDGLADGVAAGRWGRAWLWLQVEHGVDARYPRLHQQGSDLSAPSPWSDSVWAALRVLRKLHPSALS